MLRSASLAGGCRHCSLSPVSTGYISPLGRAFPSPGEFVPSLADQHDLNAQTGPSSTGRALGLACALGSAALSCELHTLVFPDPWALPQFLPLNLSLETPLSL